MYEAVAWSIYELFHIYFTSDHNIPPSIRHAIPEIVAFHSCILFSNFQTDQTIVLTSWGSAKPVIGKNDLTEILAVGKEYQFILSFSLKRVSVTCCCYSTPSCSDLSVHVRSCCMIEVFLSTDSWYFRCQHSHSVRTQRKPWSSRPIYWAMTNYVQKTMNRRSCVFTMTWSVEKSVYVERSA